LLVCTTAQDAARAVQLVPGFVKGYYRVAKAQLEQGKCEQAIASAAAGLALDPTDRSGSVKDFQKLQAAAEAQLQQQLAQAQRDSNSDDAAAAALDEHDGLESHEPDAIDSSGVGSEDRRFSIKEFKTVNELGTGNFSTILTVEHKRTGKRYALKVIDKSEASRIKRRHPNVYNEIYMEKRALTKVSESLLIFQSVTKAMYHIEGFIAVLGVCLARMRRLKIEQ
jgi:hypothetical protein